MKAMETLQDLIEEAKLRTVWWALCILLLSYFLTHTSKSIWMNIPLAIFLVSALRILLNEVEFRWKVRKSQLPTYLSHLGRKQLSPNDSRLSTLPPQPKWKRKIDSPMVESALDDFVSKLLQDFVVDLWYSGITPDKEAPDLIHAIIMDVFGEVSGRVKEINLVDLLTRDIVDLISDHLDLFRRTQSAIGVDVMATLSSEQRDERLKHHLLASKELHPALISSESEYKFLQQLMGGVIAVVLRPRESQCPLVRCFARELLTCLVMQPVMNLACPLYINELLDTIFTLLNGGQFTEIVDQHSPMDEGQDQGHADNTNSVHSEFSLKQNTEFFDQGSPMSVSQVDNQKELLSDVQESPLSSTIKDQPVHPRPGDWARVLEAASHRRTEVLMPENLENMWAKGRNYKRKLEKNEAKEVRASRKDGGTTSDVVENRNRFRRSSSASDLSAQPEMRDKYANESGNIITEYYSADSSRRNEFRSVKSTLDKPLQSEAFHAPKLKCRIVGAYFEKIGSNSFAVYSIGVTDADNNSWFVKRRYRNFERLHKQLKDIPNYTLHLPPKRIFSSSTEDSFVHQRCILLDKYLQDLLSIANVVEQHEVWDFLSATSKNYSFGKSSSVMRTLAVSVDDAMDDIVRQFKGVSDGLMRKVVGPPSLLEHTPPGPPRQLTWTSDEVNNVALTNSMSESANSFSDNDDGDKDGSKGLEEAESVGQAIGWHSDNELNSKSYPPRVLKREKEFCNLDSEKKHELGNLSKSQDLSRIAKSSLVADRMDDPIGVPPEWTPPKLSLPVLNLVDNVFQLKKRGWLRRQVFWISKQILQLMMEDAIDDWLLRQIHWLRRDEIVAYGIRWIHNVLWPDGRFFLKLDAYSKMDNSPPDNTPTRSRVSAPGSFAQQLEASRRARDVKKMLFDGAPATLVSLIGQRQYRRCARDIYYFLQSGICLKQLAYAILELVIVSIFPELQTVLMDIHVNKMRDKRV